MASDPWLGLFRRRYELDTPGGMREESALALERMGLVRVAGHEYVRCARAGDTGWCPGRVYVSEDQRHCPDCGHRVEVSKEQRFRSLRLYPDVSRMRAFLRERIATTHPAVEERPVGIFRIPVARGDLVVCLVDVCAEPAVLSRHYSHRDRLVYVVGQERYQLRVPKGVPVFRLAEIALGEAESVFLRVLRRMAMRPGATRGSSPSVISAFSGQWIVPPASGPGDGRGRPSLRGQASLDTTWGQLVFYLVDGETIAVRIPGQPLRRYRYHELGMSDQRSGKPSKRWRILEGLCESDGAISWRGYARSFSAFQEHVSRLRLDLQQAFGIHADPFRYCGRSAGLRALFQASLGLAEPANDQ